MFCEITILYHFEVNVRVLSMEDGRPHFTCRSGRGRKVLLAMRMKWQHWQALLRDHRPLKHQHLRTEFVLMSKQSTSENSMACHDKATKLYSLYRCFSPCFFLGVRNEMKGVRPRSLQEVWVKGFDRRRGCKTFTVWGFCILAALGRFDEFEVLTVTYTYIT